MREILGKRCHLESAICNDNKKCVDYCKKDNNYKEIGFLKINEKNKVDWKQSVKDYETLSEENIIEKYETKKKIRNNIWSRGLVKSNIC